MNYVFPNEVFGIIEKYLGYNSQFINKKMKQKLHLPNETIKVIENIFKKNAQIFCRDNKHLINSCHIKKYTPYEMELIEKAPHIASHFGLYSYDYMYVEDNGNYAGIICNIDGLSYERRLEFYNMIYLMAYDEIIDLLKKDQDYENS